MVSLCANRVACLRPRKNCLQSWQRSTTFPTSGPWLAWNVRFPEKLIKLQKMARNKRNKMKKFGRKPPAPQKICSHAAASMGTVWGRDSKYARSCRGRQGKDTQSMSRCGCDTPSSSSCAAMTIQCEQLFWMGLAWNIRAYDVEGAFGSQQLRLGPLFEI